MAIGNLRNNNQVRPVAAPFLQVRKEADDLDGLSETLRVQVNTCVTAQSEMTTHPSRLPRCN